jgi:hypothetical protein
MKKIITATAIVFLFFGLMSLSRNDAGYHIGRPAFAICTADDIKNTCCFRFFKVLDGDVIVENPQTREMKAIAAFKHCLRTDVGCSVEMTELKSKGVGQIRHICE